MDRAALAIFFVAVVGIPAGLLWLRDKKLKRKGKTNEQVRAASRASVVRFSAIRYLGGGAAATIIGIGEFRESAIATLVLVPLGALLLFAGYAAWKRACRLDEFVENASDALERICRP